MHFEPVHCCVLQSTVLFFRPRQPAAFLHFRFCFLRPPPHDLLQVVASFHFPQSENIKIQFCAEKNFLHTH